MCVAEVRIEIGCPAMLCMGRSALIRFCSFIRLKLHVVSHEWM